MRQFRGGRRTAHLFAMKFESACKFLEVFKIEGSSTWVHFPFSATLGVAPALVADKPHGGSLPMSILFCTPMGKVDIMKEEAVSE